MVGSMKRTLVADGKSPSRRSELEDRLFEISAVGADAITGIYRSNKIHNRFEVHVSYADGASEWFSVLADLPYEGTAEGLVGTNCAFSFQLQEPFETISFEFKNTPSPNMILTRDGQVTKPGKTSAAKSDAVILFDVSDLVYYIGHHDNLTGIQRVQACVLLGLVKGHPDQRREYISYNNIISEFNVITASFSRLCLSTYPCRSPHVVAPSTDGRPPWHPTELLPPVAHPPRAGGTPRSLFARRSLG
jgi:hypothetical protein